MLFLVPNYPVVRKPFNISLGSPHLSILPAPNDLRLKFFAQAKHMLADERA